MLMVVYNLYDFNQLFIIYVQVYVNAIINNEAADFYLSFK